MISQKAVVLVCLVALSSCTGAAGGAGKPCSDEDECEAGGSCKPARAGLNVELACGPAGAGGRPRDATCASDDDCESGLCEQHLCVEVCTACDDGMLCVGGTIHRFGIDIAAGTCARRPLDEPLRFADIATTEDGSGDIRFDVPAGIRAFTIAIRDDDGARVAARSIVAPDGTVLLDVFDTADDLNPGYAYIGTATTLVPSTDRPAAAPGPGTYVLRVGTYDPNDFAALTPQPGVVDEVEIRFERTGEEGGLLDVKVHLANALGIRPENAAEDPFVLAMMARFKAMLEEQAFIQTGAVTFAAMDDDDHNVVEDGNEARAMCKLRAGGGDSGAAVNVFLVEDISFAAGFSGGIPGPPGLYGTPASGIVMRALGDGNSTGILMAHETLHFLGLRHTTELNGGSDPIDDTPACASGTAVEDCSDYSNLMFPTFPLSNDLELTAGQRRVVRGNPLLHEIPRRAACPDSESVVDITGVRRANGDLSLSANRRVHLLRLSGSTPAQLISVRADGFSPDVVVRRSSCADGEEVARHPANGDDVVELTTPPLDAGAYFIVVESSAASGRYLLDVGALR